MEKKHVLFCLFNFLTSQALRLTMAIQKISFSNCNFIDLIYEFRDSILFLLKINQNPVCIFYQ